MNRRALLIGGASAAVAAAAGLVVAEPSSRHHLRQLVRPDPEPPHPVPHGAVGPVVSGSFRSAAMRRTIGWSIAYPAGSPSGAPLPVLLVLHGRGDDHRTVLGSHHLGAFLSEAVRRGAAPFAVAAVDGGDHSYWHRRRTGEDPQQMVIEELLPLLSQRRLRTDRLALGGWSMGGYGALLLAERLGGTVAAVAVDSPAIWLRWKDSAGGAFDDRADFDAHNVLHGLSHLARVPLRVSCGMEDPFLPGVRALLRALPDAERDLAPGGHDVAWWQHATPAQLDFVARHLARTEG